MAAKELNKKILNLRTTYDRERTKVKDSMKSGAGTQDIYKPTWQHISSRKTKSNLQGDDDSNGEGEDVDDDAASIDDESFSQIACASTKRPLQKSQSTRLRKKRNFDNEMIQKTVDCKQQLTKSLTCQQQQSFRNDDQVFGDFVCSSLKSMTEEAKRSTKIAIQRAILDGMSMYAPGPTGPLTYGQGSAGPQMYAKGPSGLHMYGLGADGTQIYDQGAATTSTLCQASSASVLSPASIISESLDMVDACVGDASTVPLTPEEKQAELKKRIENRDFLNSMAMTEAQRDSIRWNLNLLENNLSVANLITPLLEADILNEEDAAMIQSKPTPRKQSKYFLLNVFLKKANWAFDELILVLLNNRKQELANLLDPEKKCPLRYLAA